jgi:hypothetical protein
MEAALKDTLRDLERKAARQDTGGRQVCVESSASAGACYPCRVWQVFVRRGEIDVDVDVHASELEVWSDI